MKALLFAPIAGALAAATLVGNSLHAQPAAGARAAFERVIEVFNARFKNPALTGDPDRDFASVYIAHQEDLIFLAKTQLEYGSDQQLRRLAQKILDEQQRAIEDMKTWQTRARPVEPSAQTRQPFAAIAAQPPAAPQFPVASPPPADLPLIAGRVEKIDESQGKVTIDHGPIPNLKMDSMRMVFRTQDPGILKAVKPGDRIRFTADRVNGQISVIKILKR